MPNNAIVRLDKDLANNFLLSTSGQNSKHHSRKNSYDPTTTNVDINLLAKKLNNQMINKDLLLNEEEFDEETSASQEQEVAANPVVMAIVEEDTQILRHRRNNSKDLNTEEAPNELIKIDNNAATTGK